MTLIGTKIGSGQMTGGIAGVRGATGAGIANVVQNEDYTITITLTNGSTYTTNPVPGFASIAVDGSGNLVVTNTDGTTETLDIGLDEYKTTLDGLVDDAESAEHNASTSETNANTSALKSEGYAVGAQNGTDVSSGTYYQNNSKYYSTQASNSATSASSSASTATTQANLAQAYAAQFVGAPRVASTVAGMTDTDLIYVYTGSETGYTSGNWYYYGGSSWVSGGVYNSSALSTDKTLSVENSAADAAACGDIKDDLSDVGSHPPETIYYSLTAGVVISADGTISTASTAFSASNKLDISNYKQLIVTTEIGFGYMLYAFYDENDTFISGAQSASSAYTTLTNEVVEIPNTAKYFYVCAKNNEYAVVLKGVKRYTLNIESSVTTIQNQMSAYPAKTVLSEVAFTQVTGEYISAQGAITAASDSYYTTGYVDVSAYSTIYITASGNWGNALYAFYDSDNTLVRVGPVTEISSTYATLEDSAVSIPTGATYVVVAGRYASLSPDIKIFDSYQPLGKWSTKTWVCVGDSLTEENAAASKHYFDYISDITDVNVTNMGIGGTGYKRGEGDSKAFYQRISSVSSDADFVTIFGSGNDLNTSLNYSIGTYTDSGTTTLCGCINETLDAFYAVCPTMPIGIIAPTPWKGWSTTTPNNRMELYVSAMKQICEYRGVPFLDLYHESNLRPEDDTNRSLCFYSGTLDDNADGVHPNDLGHEIIAPKIYEFIKKLLIY